MLLNHMIQSLEEWKAMSKENYGIHVTTLMLASGHILRELRPFLMTFFFRIVSYNS